MLNRNQIIQRLNKYIKYKKFNTKICWHLSNALNSLKNKNYNKAFKALAFAYYLSGKNPEIKILLNSLTHITKSIELMHYYLTLAALKKNYLSESVKTIAKELLKVYKFYFKYKRIYEQLNKQLNNNKTISEKTTKKHKLAKEKLIFYNNLSTELLKLKQEFEYKEIIEKNAAQINPIIENIYAEGYIAQMSKQEYEDFIQEQKNYIKFLKEYTNKINKTSNTDIYNKLIEDFKNKKQNFSKIKNQTPHPFNGGE